MNSLVIGNGLNLTNKENNFLNTKEIASRFKDNLSIYWNVIEKLIYKDKLDISEILKRLEIILKIGILIEKLTIYMAI